MLFLVVTVCTDPNRSNGISTTPVAEIGTEKKVDFAMDVEIVVKSETRVDFPVE